MIEELNERSRNILGAIIEDFIETGEPVGSRAITRRHKMNLSPATVRNVMSDLEEAGFLYSPHTSAGRIPTEKGYRFYVDSLAHFREPGVLLEKEFAEGRFLEGMGLEERLQRAGRILSATSSYAGIVSAPSFDGTVFRHIEFVKLSEQKILAILVSRSGAVQNKIVESLEPISSGDLEKITNFVNSRLTGLTIREVKELIVREMAREKALYDTLYRRAFLLSQKALEDHPEADILIEGASNILEQPEFADLERMKKLFRAFEQKNLLVKLLDQCRGADGIRVFIGSEFDLVELEGCSLVTSTYTSVSGISGTLGVLGPSRMPYSAVIPLVYQSARLVSRFLEEE